MLPEPIASLPVEQVPRDPRFRPLAALTRVQTDLRYASSHNFAGRILYQGYDCAWLRAEAFAGLESAASWLAQQAPGWTLRVLDALRPQRVQEAIWREVAGTPAALYFADPVRGSIHSFGMAVDVTLADAQGCEADMGSAFDEMSPLSHPVLHARHLADGQLSRAQVERRELLARAMAAGGFHGIDTEWWHFDHGDRDAVRRHFPRVE